MATSNAPDLRTAAIVGAAILSGRWVCTKDRVVSSDYFQWVHSDEHRPKRYGIRRSATPSQRCVKAMLADLRERGGLPEGVE